MNKKALFLLLFLSLPLSLSALHLNLKVGMGGHRYSLYDVNYYKRNLTKWDPLYGATVELNFSRAFALETGAYLKKYRGDVELRFTDSTTGYIYKYKSKFDTKYVSVPILFKTYFLSEEISPFLLFGVNLDFYKSHKYGEENKNKIVIGPFDGEFKKHATFMVIGIGSLLFPTRPTFRRRFTTPEASTSSTSWGRTTGTSRPEALSSSFPRDFNGRALPSLPLRRSPWEKLSHLFSRSLRSRGRSWRRRPRRRGSGSL